MVKYAMPFKGTPYEMGYAHGTLMKENTTQFINAVWAYLEEQVVMYFILYSGTLIAHYSIPASRVCICICIFSVD